MKAVTQMTEGNIQADVNLGELLSEVVRPFTLSIAQVLLDAIQGLEERQHIPLIGLLGGSEARLVHAVVDQVVLPAVGLLDLGLQVLRVEADGGVLGVEEVVELGTEHAQDLARLVAHDAPALLVVEGGHGVAAGVLGLGLEVDVAEVGEALVQRVRDDVIGGGGLVRGGEAPAALAEVPVDDGEGDEVLEALELAGDQGAVGPGAGIGNIEVVAALLGGELGGGVPRDPVPEGADLALELAGRVAGLDPVGDAALGRSVGEL